MGSNQKVKRTEYELKIPEFPKPNKAVLYTVNKFFLTCGYIRVVCGERGPYVEINPDQIYTPNIFIPPNQEWRLDPQYSDKVYYTEYRSKCDAYVKIYFQRQRVKYADYKVGKYYISPFDLYFLHIDILRKCAEWVHS